MSMTMREMEDVARFLDSNYDMGAGDKLRQLWRKNQRLRAQNYAFTLAMQRSIVVVVNNNGEVVKPGMELVPPPKYTNLGTTPVNSPQEEKDEPGPADGTG